jgi:hypothetical protein
VRQEGGWAAEGLVRQICRQGQAYGGWGDVSLQPGGDTRGQVGRVAGRKEQAGVVAAQVGEEVDGLLEEGGGGARGLRDGRESLLAGRRLLRRRLPRVGRPCGLAVGVTGSPRLVAGDGAGHDAALGEADAFTTQVAVGLQFAQGGGDAGGALREAGGQGLDVDAGALGQRLDVAGQTDRQEGEFRVLGEVVADHREARGVAGVVVPEAAARVGLPLVRVVVGGKPGPGARGRARVLRIHQEGPNFLGGQALALGLQSRRGPSHVCGCVAVSVEPARGRRSSRVGNVHPGE